MSRVTKNIEIIITTNPWFETNYFEASRSNFGSVHDY